MLSYPLRNSSYCSTVSGKSIQSDNNSSEDLESTESDDISINSNFEYGAEVLDETIDLLSKGDFVKQK